MAAPGVPQENGAETEKIPEPDDMRKLSELREIGSFFSHQHLSGGSRLRISLLDDL